MSLILEALKKSEAERQLGRAPGLTTPMPNIARRRRSPLPLAGVGLVAAAITGAVVWWALRSTPEPVAKPKPSVVSAVAEPASVPTAMAPAATEAVPDAPPPRVAATAPPRKPAVQAPPALIVATAPAASTPEAPAAQTPAVEEPTPVVAAATQPALPVEDLPRLDQLPGSDRSALPPLKLSMHVYADAAPDRFVLIDGRRYREGEKLADSLQVIEIRRDGTVLDFNGRRFLLMRP